MKYLFIVLSTMATLPCLAQSKKLKGTWDNQNGQILVFQKNNKALWIFYSEEKRDTFNIQYAADFKTTPNQLDLSGFATGTLQGKTLFGILEFKSNNIIRFDCEPGTADTVRPKVFHPEQTQTYYKKQQ